MDKFKNVSEIYKETQDFNGPSEETTKKPFDRAKKYLDKLETMDYVYGMMSQKKGEIVAVEDGKKTRGVNYEIELSKDRDFQAKGYISVIPTPLHTVNTYLRFVDSEDDTPFGESGQAHYMESFPDFNFWVDAFEEILKDTPYYLQKITLGDGSPYPERMPNHDTDIVFFIDRKPDLYSLTFKIYDDESHNSLAYDDTHYVEKGESIEEYFEAYPTTKPHTCKDLVWEETGTTEYPAAKFKPMPNSDLTFSATYIKLRPC